MNREELRTAVNAKSTLYHKATDSIFMPTTINEDGKVLGTAYDYRQKPIEDWTRIEYARTWELASEEQIRKFTIRQSEGAPQVSEPTLSPLNRIYNELGDALKDVEESKDRTITELARMEFKMKASAILTEIQSLLWKP